MLPNFIRLDYLSPARWEWVLSNARTIRKSQKFFKGVKYHKKGN